MTVPPYIAARIAAVTHAEAIAAAQRRHLKGQAAAYRSIARVRIPDRVPRSWRRRYG